jgi:hypothetical protein
VCCFVDAENRPVQLLCVRNLRACIESRLIAPAGEMERTKRVDYRAVVRSIRFCRVDSVIEQEMVYLGAVERLFADQYRRLVPERPVWFVQVDPADRCPRFVKSEQLGSAGRSFGPIAEKQQAQALVEMIEDLFDLCRYQHILLQSPDGRACAYKEMGKCPAPCDGSISLAGYRMQIHLAIDTLSDPQSAADQHETRMQQAARALQFEQAGAIKQIVQSLRSLSEGAYRLLQPMDRFAYLAIQPGPRKRAAKLFAILPRSIEPICSIRDTTKPSPGVLATVLSFFERLQSTQDDARITPRTTDLFASIAQHMLSSKPMGVYLPTTALDEDALKRALQSLARQKELPASEDEGITRGID